LPITAADRVEILELLARYNRAADTDNMDALLACFLPDGEVSSPFGTARGHAGIEESRRKVAASSAAERLRGGQHWVNNVIVEDAGEDEATVSADHVLIKPTADGTGVITVVGAYDDRVRKVDGRWLFVSRTVSTLSA
jgi:hypothetical protein